MTAQRMFLTKPIKPRDPCGDVEWPGHKPSITPKSPSPGGGRVMKTALFRVTFATALLGGWIHRGTTVAGTHRRGRPDGSRLRNADVPRRMKASSQRSRLAFAITRSGSSRSPTDQHRLFGIPPTDQRLKPRSSTSWRTRAAKRPRRTGGKFSADPEWQKVAAASQMDGKILAKSPESVFLNATDYSPIK